MAWCSFQCLKVSVAFESWALLLLTLLSLAGGLLFGVAFVLELL